MSRIAKQPIEIPSGVEVAVDGRSVTVKGKKGSLQHELDPAVLVATHLGQQIQHLSSVLVGVAEVLLARSAAVAAGDHRI